MTSTNNDRLDSAKKAGAKITKKPWLCTNCSQKPRQEHDELCPECRYVYEYDQARQEMH